MATSLPAKVAPRMIPCEWSFASFESAGLRFVRYGANAPGHTTSSIITSTDDDFDEKSRASCAYESVDAWGWAMTLTLIPVSLVNRAASARSRLCVRPMLSPMKVIDCPPYFALIAAAFATLGGLTAAAVLWLDVPAVPAATISRARASAAASPTTASAARCFTLHVLSEHAEPSA